MAYTTINNGSEYFNTVLYTGNGGTQSVIGVGFQPDLVWNKSRSSAYVHGLNDVVRGAGNTLISNSTDEEQAWSAYFTSFDSDGFSMATGGGTFNASGTTYASWNWKANGAGVSNTDGSITSTVSANTTSGFSIVSWTGTGAAATVGHGLGVVPKITIVKGREAVTNWIVGGSLIVDVGGSTNNYMILNGTAGMDTSVDLYASYNTDTIGVKTDTNINGSGQGMVMYCFADVKGFSKFGSYTGNGSADGTFVYTGFKPAFVMVKETSNINSWRILDNKRSPINVMNKPLFANLSNAEGTADHETDFVSNGFKIRSSDTNMNRSGGTFIYMCFAENPFVTSTKTPTTAR